MIDLFRFLQDRVFPHIYLISFEYILYCLRDILFNIVAYITNPIVVLFADEYGNLPRVLRYWQTYDNCLDVDWMVTKGIVPKLFQYDFNKHYRYHLEEKDNEGNVIPGYVEILDSHFTIKERIQRYFCRLAWVNRNAAYGFSYEVSGVEYTGDDMSIFRDSNHERVVYIPGTNIFSLKFEIPWYCFGKKFDFDIYLGWKLNPSLQRDKKARAMLAMRISPFHSWKWDD